MSRLFLYLYPDSNTCSLKSCANPVQCLGFFSFKIGPHLFIEIWNIIMASYSGDCYGVLGSPAYTLRITLKKCRKACKV